MALILYWAGEDDQGNFRVMRWVECTSSSSGCCTGQHPNRNTPIFWAQAINWKLHIIEGLDHPAPRSGHAMAPWYRRVFLFGGLAEVKGKREYVSGKDAAVNAPDVWWIFGTCVCLCLPVERLMIRCACTCGTPAFRDTTLCMEMNAKP